MDQHQNRIVRDYEKYIARQLKRGTSRQELNVSWLKKNELDLKRHVQELRDNIRTNWSTTGQELGKELRQFWPSSRPQSPARVPSQNPLGATYATSASSSSAALGNGGAAGHGHGSGIDTPTSPSGSSLLGPRSPGVEGRGPGGQNDFMTGYTLGLIGGVRSWVSDFLDCPLPLLCSPPMCDMIFMFAPFCCGRLTGRQMTKNRRNVRDSRPPSDDDSDEDHGRKESAGESTGGSQSRSAAAGGTVAATTA